MYRLLRFFSIASLISLIVVAALLGGMYRYFATEDLVRVTQESNVVLTRAISNSIWEFFTPLVSNASDYSNEALATSHQVEMFDAEVRRQIFGLPVLSVKFFDIDGRTLYSTERSQIGVIKKGHTGFEMARKGKITSDYSFRETFKTNDEVLKDRHVISIYAPVWGNDRDRTLEGVIELYIDATSNIEGIKRSQNQVVVSSSLILFVLYIVLFFIVRHGSIRFKGAQKQLSLQTQELAKANNVLAAEISERRLAEEALQQSEQQNQRLIENITDIIYTVDMEGNFTSINQVATKITGYSKDEIMAMKFLDMIDQESIPILVEKLNRRVGGFTGDDIYEVAMHTKDGKRVWLEVNSSVVISEGRLVGTQGVARNITKRHEAQEQLIASEREYSKILDDMQDTYYRTDVNGVLTRVSKGGERLLGYKPEEAIGKKLEGLYVRPENRIEMLNMLRDNNGIVENFESLMRRKDGTFAWVLSSSHFMYDDEGNVVGIEGVARDITERIKSERALKKSQQRLALAQEAAHQVSWDMDLGTKKVIWTGEINSLLGLEKNIIGDSFVAYGVIVHPDDREMVEEIREKALEDGSEYDIEHRIVRGDGSVRWVRTRGKTIRDETQNKTRLLGVIWDITDQKEVEFELKKAKEIAEDISRAKSEFLANMSHEIRTPMNGVLGMVTLLATTELSPRQRDYVETIRKSGDSLLSIISDILDFSKIEAGKLELEYTDFNLDTLVEDVTDMLAQHAQSKNLELISDIPLDIPVAIHGDPGRLRQIIINLVGNAIKFTDKGEVVVRVSTAKASKDDITFQFEIIDTGIGISEKGKSNLFKSFSQADGSTTRKYGGTGLGLAISKQLVEMMEGSIGVKSEPGKGSTFWFTVRLSTQKDLPAMPLSTKTALDGARILLVDERKTNQRIFQHQTASWGMQNEVVANGHQALEILRDWNKSKKPFDVVMLKWLMPEMNGLELAGLINADPDINDVRMLLLASLGQNVDMTTARQVGISACLTKPIRRSQLYDCLARVLGVARENCQNEEPFQHDINNSSLGASNMTILIAEDNLTNQKVLVHLLEKFGFVSDVVSNGVEALEAIKHKRYTMVMMDCQMPEMDGFEATRQIRKLEERSGDHATIIAMTANAMQGDRERCLDSGMDDYLAKPLRLEDLNRVILRWTKAKTRKNSTAILANETDKLVSLKMDQLRNVFGADDESIERVLRLFLKLTKTKVERLKEHLQQENWEAIMDLSHDIKGSSANIGAVVLSELSNKMGLALMEGRNEKVSAIYDDMLKAFVTTEEFIDGYLNKVG